MFYENSNLNLANSTDGVLFCVNSWQFYPSPKIFYTSVATDCCDKFRVCQYFSNFASGHRLQENETFLDCSSKAETSKLLLAPLVKFGLELSAHMCENVILIIWDGRMKSWECVRMSDGNLKSWDVPTWWWGVGGDVAKFYYGYYRSNRSHPGGNQGWI